MTDRFNALTIVLDRDIRSDDAEQLISAISMLRGVLSVTPNVSELSDHIATERARRDLEARIFDAIRAKP